MPQPAKSQPAAPWGNHTPAHPADYKNWGEPDDEPSMLPPNSSDRTGGGNGPVGAGGPNGGAGGGVGPGPGGVNAQHNWNEEGGSAPQHWDAEPGTINQHCVFVLCV